MFGIVDLDQAVHVESSGPPAELIGVSQGRCDGLLSFSGSYPHNLPTMESIPLNSKLAGWWFRPMGEGVEMNVAFNLGGLPGASLDVLVGQVRPWGRPQGHTVHFQHGVMLGIAKEARAFLVVPLPETFKGSASLQSAKHAQTKRLAMC